MTLPREFKCTLISLLMLGVTGCSTTDGSNFGEAAQTSRAEFQAWSYGQQNASQVSLLTDLIAIPAMTQAVEEALSQNPGLQQTALALQIVYAQKKQAVGDRLPELSAGFSGTREENSGNSYTADLTVSWELDLWQRLRDSVSAAEMDIAASQASYQASRDALAAQYYANLAAN